MQYNSSNNNSNIRNIKIAPTTAEVTTAVERTAPTTIAEKTAEITSAATTTSATISTAITSATNLQQQLH